MSKAQAPKSCPKLRSSCFTDAVLSKFTVVDAGILNTVVAWMVERLSDWRNGSARSIATRQIAPNKGLVRRDWILSNPSRSLLSLLLSVSLSRSSLSPWLLLPPFPTVLALPTCPTR